MELQAGLEATCLVKKAYHDMSHAARLFSHLFCFIFPSVKFKRQLSCRRLYPMALIWGFWWQAQSWVMRRMCQYPNEHYAPSKCFNV
jgi:hypothetical protein